MTQMELIKSKCIYNANGSEVDKAFYKSYKIMRNKYLDISQDYYDEDSDNELKYGCWLVRNSCVEMLCYLFEDFYNMLVDKNDIENYLDELYERIRV